MKTQIILSLSLCFLLIGSAGFSQNQNTTTEITDSMLIKLAEAIEDLSDYYVMKVEDTKFKVETFEGDDVTSEVNAIKSPNGYDLIIYDAEADWTSVCYDFYDDITFNDEWIPTDLLPESLTGIYWIFTNDYKSFYLIQYGSYLDMSKYSLKTSATNNSEFIISENGIEKYVIRDLAGKTQDVFYPLELLNN